MIQLYTLPSAFGLRNPSPFCLKVEMALTTLGLDFEIKTEPNPRKAPKGKMPWIVDGGIVPDSELILEYLDRKTDGALFAGLTPQEKAVGTAFTRLAEDHLYWTGVASRWLDDEWFPVVKRDFFESFLPRPLSGIVAALARRDVRRTYHLHGLGRHTLEEQAGFARRDLEAIAAQTSTAGYIAGARRTPYDFAVASMLAGFLDNRPATWLTRLAEDVPGVRDYAEKIQAETQVYCRGR